MDYAVFVGEEKTLIYKKGQGIVLNEPSITVHSEGNKVISVGKSAMKFNQQGSNIIVQPVVKHGCIQSIDNAGIFLAQMFKKIGRINNCLVCIPSSLDSNGLNLYKDAVYSAASSDVAIVFIPQVIANAIAQGYNIESTELVLSTVVEGDSADLAVIRSGEIIDGGTLSGLKKFDEAKNRLLRTYPKIKHLHGSRINVINGAGKLLANDSLIRKIVELN